VTESAISPVQPQPREPLAARWSEVRSAIAAAAARAGRDPGQVQVVAVTKGQPAAAARAALSLGLRDLGENRVQEAEAKLGAVGPGPTWHLLGPLQHNKVNRALAFVRVMHALDGAEILETVAHHAELQGRRVDVYLQINVSGEPQKHGLPAEEDPVLELAERTCDLAGVRLRGLMGMAALSSDAEAARAPFQRLAALGRALRRRWPQGPPGGDGVPPWPGLSMGMSDDYAVAIEEGATCLRLVRALFGERRAAPAD
jgi:pyridoxal phosphate enzyme (YggS family)